jgi:hypothetical protein
MEPKNKKGQFLMIGVFAIVAIIVLALIFLSTKVRFMVVGGALFVVMVSILLKGDLNKTKGIFCVVLFAGSMFFLFGAGLLQTSLAPTSFTPIFCNDYEFTCCNEVSGGGYGYTVNWVLTHSDAFVCPLTATKCEVTRTSGGQDLAYVGYGTCHYTTGLLQYWTCDSRRSWQSQSITMNPGDYIWADGGIFGSGNFAVSTKVYVAKLSFCGKAGCSVGTTVSGADQCKFNPQGGVLYTATDALAGKTTATSYTVPLGSCVLAWQSGDRHICGYKEESCSSNSDCSGHTYGNQECNGRTLQTYGCNSYGNPIVGGDRAPTASGWGADASQTSLNTYGKRCEIQSAVTVQCCGDTDCGNSQVCDKTSWTCKAPAQVSCRQNSDCGVTTTCDFTTKTLNTPKCNNPGTTSSACSFSKVNVGCCDNSNCMAGQYCSADKVCLTSIPGLQACPFECCIGDSRYVDRLCPSDKPYCVQGTCGTTADSQTPAEKEAACNLKATQQPLMGWTWTTVEKPTVWSILSFGLIKPKTEAYCKASFLIYWIIGGIILITILAIIIKVSIKSKKSKGRNKRK